MMKESKASGLHLAVIPDGNRRWAMQHKLRPWQGHQKATENLREILEWCRKDPRISVLTVWGFSTENWRRDPEMVNKLMQMFEEYLTEQREYLLSGHIRLLHSGRSDRFSPSLRKKLASLIEETKTFDAFTLNFALDYGGQDELLRAVQKIKSPEAVTDAIIRSHLDHPGLQDIDCIIRTAGEMRTSNFFLWQSTYAEWVFVKQYFPDFTIDRLKEAIDEFFGRKRRFGA